MSIIIPEELRQELESLINNGEEAKAREFIISHIKEFPEEAQGMIVTGLIEEALLNKEEGAKALQELQEKGLEQLDVIEKQEEELRNRE